MIDRILPGYGAIDIGQEKIFVACSGETAVRSFETFSADLELAAEYLVQRGITQVAMEATGVYWIPLHDLLESRRIQVTVFNGAHARNLPGRKSDVPDCQWHGMTKDQPPQSPEPGRKIKVVRHNAPAIEGLHQLLITLTGGRDATRLPAISPLGFMKLIGETGTDLSRWQSEKHFTSWMGLAPGSSQSGKRRRRVPRKKTVAGQIFREAVLSLAKSKHLALGAAYRRLRARKGSAIAVIAIARKLAVLYYQLLTKGLHYVGEGVKRYEERYRQQTLRSLEKTAKAFGFALAPTPASQ